MITGLLVLLCTFAAGVAVGQATFVSSLNLRWRVEKWAEARWKGRR